MSSLFPKPYADTVARLRVPGGFLLVIAFALLSHPTARSLAIGLPVSVLGLLLRAWAAGHLAKNMALAQTGPYAYVRNPLYLAVTATILGQALLIGQFGLVAYAAVFIAITMAFVTFYEEPTLRRQFGEQYETYRSAVPGWWPRLHPWRG